MDQQKDTLNQRTENNPPPSGESINRRGEDVIKEGGKEPGRKDEGTKGKTERPLGSSTQRDQTGVNPQEPIDPESPNLIGP